MLGKHLDVLLIDLSLLEFQICGSLSHLLLIASDQPCRLPLEDGDYFFYHRAVVLLGDCTHAAAFAPSYLEVKAGAQLVAQYGFGIDFEAAGANRIVCLKEVEQLAGVEGSAVRSEIAGAVADRLAGLVNPGERVGADAYPGIGLGILEQDVVFGFVLLDEVILQQQSIRLTVHNRILGIGDSAYEHPGLGVEP